MRILAVDVGTGTQDILLFDSTQPVENALQLIMPSPTQIAAGKIAKATRAQRAVVLSGVIAGGGPCHWALDDHLRAGLTAFATPEAAATFDDDLEAVRRMGVRLISEDEAPGIDGEQVRLIDLDLGAIRTALGAFGVGGKFDGLAVGCLDHGAAPPGYSDRLFRFEHLASVVGRRNDLREFACLPEELPEYLTRARTLVSCVDGDAPTVFLDTGPAAALGALQDPQVGGSEEQLVLNLGNMHALAFHLRGTQVISLYEHHTGEMTAEQIEDFTVRLVRGELQHEEVFNSKGHGVFYAADSRQPSAVSSQPSAERQGTGNGPAQRASTVLAVTGPQRGKLRGSRLNPYFAVPHGDMMVSGCFGLLWAYAEKRPEGREEVLAALGLEAVAGV